MNQLKDPAEFSRTAEFRRVSAEFNSLWKHIIPSRSHLQLHYPQADPCGQASRTGCHSLVLHQEGTSYYHLYTALCIRAAYWLFPLARRTLSKRYSSGELQTSVLALFIFPANWWPSCCHRNCSMSTPTLLCLQHSRQPSTCPSFPMSHATFLSY